MHFSNVLQPKFQSFNIGHFEKLFAGYAERSVAYLVIKHYIIIYIGVVLIILILRQQGPISLTWINYPPTN